VTFSSTHLALSTLLIYTFSRKKYRKSYNDHPWWFFLLSIASIIPDFDLLLPQAHRTFSHSLLYPLLLLISSRYLGQIKWVKNRTNLGGTYIGIFAILWISHLLFDLTFGPLALFWPLDTRFYDISAVFRLDLNATNLFGMLLGGFFFRIRIVDGNSGVSTFFLNWSPKERTDYFGADYVELTVVNFFLHIFLFIWYLIFVFRPIIVDIYVRCLKIDESEGRGNLQKAAGFIIRMKSIIWKIQRGVIDSNFYNSFTVLGLLGLMISGIVIGPVGGESWQEETTSNDNFHSYSDSFRYISLRSYNIANNQKFSISYEFSNSSGDLISYTSFIIIIQREDGLKFLNEISSNSSLIGTEITRAEFDNYYMTKVLELTSENNRYENSGSSFGEFNLVNQTEDFNILYGWVSWNTSQHFSRGVRIGLLKVTNRMSSYNFGLTLIIFSFSLLFTHVIVETRKKQPE